MKIRDIDCTFKLYKRVIFDNIKLVSSGVLIDAEILARAIRKGYRLVQRGVHHYPRTTGVQSSANLRVILHVFKEIYTARQNPDWKLTADMKCDKQKVRSRQ